MNVFFSDKDKQLKHSEQLSELHIAILLIVILVSSIFSIVKSYLLNTVSMEVVGVPIIFMITAGVLLLAVIAPQKKLEASQKMIFFIFYHRTIHAVNGLISAFFLVGSLVILLAVTGQYSFTEIHVFGSATVESFLRSIFYAVTAMGYLHSQRSARDAMTSTISPKIADQMISNKQIKRSGLVLATTISSVLLFVLYLDNRSPILHISGIVVVFDLIVLILFKLPENLLLKDMDTTTA